MEDKKYLTFQLIIFLALGMGFSGGSATATRPTQSKAPYATDEPLNEPRLFAEGVISTNTDEFGAMFTPDGRTCFFSKSVPRSYLYTICVSHFEKSQWSTTEIAPFSGRHWDFDPVISPDGTKLYFGSDRAADGGSKKDFDIWMVEKTPSGWGEPKNLGAPINSEANEVFDSVTADGTIYFGSNRAGGRASGDYDIYRSRLVNGKYAEPERLGDAINSPVLEFEVYIAPDESFMLVGAAGRPDSYGSFDIYASFNRNGAWTPLKNLGPKVNTPAREYSPRISRLTGSTFFSPASDSSGPPRRWPNASAIENSGPSSVAL